MPEITTGGSVQCCAFRLTQLEQDGVPIGPWYCSDAMTKFEAVPVTTKGVDMEVVNACGAPEIIYHDMDRFKRYDVTWDLIYLDPELEAMLEGGELYNSGGLDIGSSGPVVAAYAGYYPGFSLELWSKRVVNGDLDPIYPYWRWNIPRVRLWQGSAITWDNNPMARSYMGYTAPNSNWEDGPFDDWPFASDTQLFRAATKTLPAGLNVNGTQFYAHS